MGGVVHRFDPMAIGVKEPTRRHGHTQWFATGHQELDLLPRLDFVATHQRDPPR